MITSFVARSAVRLSNSPVTGLTPMLTGQKIQAVVQDVTEHPASIQTNQGPALINITAEDLIIQAIKGFRNAQGLDKNPLPKAP